VFERDLVIALLRSDGEGLLVLNPSDFEDPKCREAFVFLRKFFSSYSRMPTVEEFLKLHGVEWKEHLSGYDSVNPAKEYLNNQIKRAKLHSKVIKALDFAKRGEMDRAFEVLTEPVPVNESVVPVSTIALDGAPGQPLEFQFTPLRERIKPGTLSLVLGPTNIGKSFFLVNLACHVADKDVVCFVSLELPSWEVAKRLAACYFKKKIAEVDGDDLKGLNKIHLMQLQPQVSFVESLNALKRLNPKLVLIDYADLFHKSFDIRGSLIRIYYWLKGFANSLPCAVVTVSQVNRVGILDRVSIVHTAECIDKVFVSDYVFGLLGAGGNALVLRTLKARSSEKAPDVLLETDFSRALIYEKEV